MSEKKVWSRRILWAAGYVAVFIAAFVYLKSDSSRGTTLNEAYKQEIRNALAEIDFPSSNNLTEISTATNNLSDFMNYRAGVQLDQATKNLLNTTEQEFWSQSKHIDPHVLAQIITELTIDQIPSLTNAQIEDIAESFSGFSAQGLPQTLALGRLDVALRASGRGFMSKSGFISELTQLRDQGVNSKPVETMIYLAVHDEIKRKAGLVYEAEPSLFTGADLEMTPILATLITYAVVTDDQLVFNQSGLSDHMAQRQQIIQNKLGSSYPSPSGHKAYGQNGYVFSSPSHIIFTSSNVNALVSQIQARGN